MLIQESVADVDSKDAFLVDSDRPVLESIAFPATIIH